MLESPLSASLVFRVHEHLCAIPVEHVVETLRPLPVIAVADAPACVLGLTVIRGEPVAVVDASRLLFARETEASRLVVVRVGERRVALAVGEVLGVSTIQDASLRRLPPLLGDRENAVVSQVGALDTELLLVLRSARFVPEEAWPTIRQITPA